MTRKVKLLAAGLITLAVLAFVMTLIARRPPPPTLGWNDAIFAAELA